MSRTPTPISNAPADLLIRNRPNWSTMTPDSLSAEVALEAGTPRGDALAMLQAERTIADWCKGLCDEEAA